MYVIKRITDGAFVTSSRKSPDGGSYCRSLQHAVAWPTREAADANRCPENEVVVDVEDLLV